VRWTLAKYYHSGGLHVGFALAGTVWYLTFVAMMIYGFAAGKGGVDVANIAVSSGAASLIVVIVFMARPGSGPSGMTRSRRRTGSAAERCWCSCG
jgi:hypothetical protein